MYVYFSEQLAIDFDLEVEYFLRNLVGWIGTNAFKDDPNSRNFHEGKYWSYNSYPEYSKLIPVLSKKQIRTVSARAVKGGLLEISNFNKKKYDNTNWYTLTQKGWEYFEREAKRIYPASSVESNTPELELNTPAQMGRPPAQMGRPIPLKPNTLSSNINITTSESVDSAVAATKVNKKNNLELLWEMIAVYKQTFPNNPQPHPKAISTSLQKTLQTLIKRWPETDPKSRPFSIELFKRYMEGLRDIAPRFSLSEYTTASGNKKKNNMETFCRWNTFVKFLEDQYS